MATRNLGAAILITLVAAQAGADDWGRLPVPADPGPGLQWQLDEDVSDSFNYEFEPTAERAVIGGKWNNYYLNGGWKGPGTTIWRHENAAVSRGKLWIRATRKPGETKAFQHDKDGDGVAETLDLPATRLACLTSVEPVVYPVFIEARVKVANAVLASDVWMLSRDSTQEIDILECYGGRGDDNRGDWFAKRMHLSHHVFIRRPLQDYQPKDKSTWHYWDGPKPKRGKSYWTSRFHRVGVYWRDPTHLEYYVDGELAKTTSGMDDTGEKGGIDPRGYTKDESGERTGLSKPMHLILNMEAQDWNAAAGRTPTDKELKRKKDHTFLVDWLRVYKPVKADAS